MITKRGAGFPRSVETVASETSRDLHGELHDRPPRARDDREGAGSRELDDEALGAVPERRAGGDRRPRVDAIPVPRATAGVHRGRARSVTAREGALKIREAARVLAEGYDVEYLLHGSAVPLDGRDRLVTLEPPDRGVRPGGRRAPPRPKASPVTALGEPAPLPPSSRRSRSPSGSSSWRSASPRSSEGQDPDTVITGAWADEALWRSVRLVTDAGAAGPRRPPDPSQVVERSARIAGERPRAPRSPPAHDGALLRSPCVVQTPRPLGTAGRDVLAAERHQQLHLDRRMRQGRLERLEQPVDALARQRRDRRPTRVPPASRARARSRRRGRSCSGRAPRGCQPAPISPSTARTASICSSSSGEDASATCTTRSARVTSSSVERNASTRSCGSLPTNPTVSEIVRRRPPGQLRAGAPWDRASRTAGRPRTRRRRVSRVHQRRLAGVRVARRSRPAARRCPGAAPASCRGSCASALMSRRSFAMRAADVLAVDLHLRLAAADPCADAAAEPAHRLAPAPQAGQQVVQLRELDLGLALRGCGRAARRCRGSARCGRSPSRRAAPRACAAGPA